MGGQGPVWRASCWPGRPGIGRASRWAPNPLRWLHTLRTGARLRGPQAPGAGDGACWCRGHDSGCRSINYRKKHVRIHDQSGLVVPESLIPQQVGQGHREEAKDRNPCWLFAKMKKTGCQAYVFTQKRTNEFITRGFLLH